MKQCISRIIRWIIHLWRTLQKYVHISKHGNKSRLHVEIDLVDTHNSISLETTSDATSDQVDNQMLSDAIIIEEDKSDDAKSNSLLESSRNEES